MKTPCLLLLALTTAMAAALQAQPAPAATRETRAARTDWFREAKFGLFIHWGLYAIPAGEWKGQPVPRIGEWIMNRAKIPVAEYADLAKEFNLPAQASGEYASVLCVDLKIEGK